uniref:Uncharacterized protein n=1 Tax=Echinococcus canadensis TaxID=519352 RepID=A0A915EYC3_9CEST
TDRRLKSPCRERYSTQGCTLKSTLFMPQFRQILDECISALREEESIDEIAAKTMCQNKASIHELFMSVLMTANDLYTSI